MVLCALNSVSYASTLKYQPVITLSTGTSTPNQFAIGDFNGDGKLDLAIPDQDGKTVSVYLNQGNGTFSAPIVTTLAIDNTLFGVICGDVNEDGKADLIVGTLAGDQVAIVLLGNGDGTFAPQPPIPGSFGILSGQLADFNGDGHLDLFIGENGQTYFFLGKGDGTFSPPINPEGSIGTYFGITVGDFNGDHKLDAIGANISGSIDFFPGNGQGSFSTSVSIVSPIINSPQSVDSADFNHDGKLDLLIGSSSIASVMFGNGDGTFQSDADQMVILGGEQAGSTTIDSVNAVVADLDQDGNPDAVIMDGTSGVLTLVLNDGTGMFPDASATPYSFHLPPYSYYAATADFNGDGLPDIVVSNQAAKTMSLLLSVKPLISPTLSLASSASSALVGASLSFTLEVSGGVKTPTGTASLLDGGSSISKQTLDASGNATFDLSNLAVGVHSLSASYSGDSNFAPATSTLLSQSITDFKIALTPGSQTVAAGTTAKYLLTVTPEAGFAGTVSVTCSGLPALASCDTQPISVAGNPVTATISVSTTPTTSAMVSQTPELMYAGAFCGCLSFFWMRKQKGKRRQYFLGAPFIALLVSLAGITGCGGGNSPKTVPGTPSGASTITISTTASENGISVTHTAMATLVVQ